MGQLIAVMLSLMLLLTVPLGVLQTHVVLQARSELLEVSAAAVKHVSNHGGVSDVDVLQKVRDLISRELAEKQFSLSEQEIAVTVVRTRGADPVLWSHADEFLLRLEIPCPRFTPLIPVPMDSLEVTRHGTINIMDYDL
jgi:hypothetical protein